MVTEPVIKQDETSTNVNFGADNPQVNTGHHSGSTAQPIPILGQNPAQQTPPMAASHEQASNTMGDYTSRIVKDKGDYFSHDNKGYYRKDGKTYQITDAPEGDVELDADQTAKLDQARADKAGQDQKVKDAMANQEVITEGFTNDPDKEANPNKIHEEETTRKQQVKDTMANQEVVTEGFAPSEEGQRVLNTGVPPFWPLQDFAEGFINEGKPTDAEMWNASLQRQAGRIVGGASALPDGEGLGDLAKAGYAGIRSQFGGRPLTDAEKWQLAYNAGKLATYWAGGRLIGGMKGSIQK